LNGVLFKEAMKFLTKDEQNIAFELGDRIEED
jgi:hypothetical protein